MILEFLFYLSISTFPMALPIAVLISSVMVMGNLAERYELASMKSAGIPLLRIMQPMIAACVFITIFSWTSSNYLIPVANLKFKSRLYDMRKQKPSLNLEEGIFNDDFEGYRIRIGEKGKDNRTIKNVFIANHADVQKDKLNELVAKDGEMYTTSNQRYMVMELNQGEQFQEGDRHIKTKTKAPFIRTSFEKYTKIFDMNEFEINRTDEDLFKSHYSMLSTPQLKAAIDSIDRQINDRKNTVSEYVGNYFKIPERETKTDSLNTDSTQNAPSKKEKLFQDRQKILNKQAASKNKPPVKPKVKKKNPSPVKINKTKRNQFKNPPHKQIITKPLNEYNSLIELFEKHRMASLSDKAMQFSRSIKSNADSAVNFIMKTSEKKVKHVFELQSKYAFAVVCVVFLFIGAPMGAIVRKGGFGYPLLVAIIFFMLFITLTMTFKKMAEAFAVPTLLAVWLPNLILFPIGLFLTYKAMNDSKIINLDQMTAFFRKIFQRLAMGKQLES